MGLYAEIMTTVDTSCRTFIQDNVVAIAEGIKDPVFTMLGVYVLFWGFAHMTNHIQEPITDAVKRLLKIMFILGIAFNAATYNAYVTETITSGPEQLASLLTGAGSAPQVASTIEKIYADMWAVGSKFWNNAGVFDGNFGFYFVAVIIYGIACALSAYAAFLVILSKVAIAILVAIGPLFIVATLFDATRRFFENWAGMLCNYGLILVLVVGINTFILSIFNAYLAQAVTDNGIEIGTAAPVAATALICFFVLAQVQGMASGLAGGISLSSMGFGRWVGQKASAASGKASQAVASGAVATTKLVARKPVIRYNVSRGK